MSELPLLSSQRIPPRRSSAPKRSLSAGWKWWFCLFLLGAMALAGCRSHYQITLSNGHKITTQGKPKWENGWYRYRDINGRTNYVSEGSVSVIEPQPRGYKEDSAFNPARTR